MAHPQHKIHESYDAKQYVKDQDRSKKHVAQNYRRKADEQLAVDTQVQTLQEETSAAKKLKLAAEVEAAKVGKTLQTLKVLTDTGPRVTATQQNQRLLEDEPPVCFILDCDRIAKDAKLAELAELARQEINVMRHGIGSERWGPIRNKGDDEEKSKSKRKDSGR